MNETRRKKFLSCHRCDTATVHSLLCRADSDVERCDAEGYKSYEPATYSIFQCDGCTRISVYIWSAFHSPLSEFGEQDYPPGFLDIRGAPAAVSLAYQQAEHVKSRSKVAYAVLARKVLDAIVKDRCAEERNLSRALNVLATRGEIPSLLAEAANHIRLFGNAAAHEANMHITEIHVQMIDKFLAVLVDHLYTAPTALKEFKVLLDMDGDEQVDV
ncbi:DUF4145 domain-containing protein [Variovorax paradoxus]|uniref:DUF4145 domain-containing protein n=1 Tax=Variovorax paradoxus TaxID=34073 RepID=A0A0H2M5S2_VARPD|nr:DUF4145 domain-containing protein [Variovorax paradoxus]KLN57476.1 hypothetical protein VPARA_15560 [Variovorax paradoxus]